MGIEIVQEDEGGPLVPSSRKLVTISDTEMDESIIGHAKKVFGDLGRYSLEVEYKGTFEDNGVELTEFDKKEEFEIFMAIMEKYFDADSFSMETLKRFLDAEGGIYKGILESLKVGDISTKERFEDFMCFLFAMYVRLREAGAISSNDLYEFNSSLFKKHGYNSLVFLRKTVETFPDPFDGDGNFLYHLVGRGFVKFASAKLLGKGEKRGVGITVPISITEPQGLAERHIEREAYHEYMGHSIGGLYDHFDGRKCVMTPLRTYAELYENLLRGDFSFCDECIGKAGDRISI